MRGCAVLLVGLLTGCSNAPVAGFLDCVAPSRARLEDEGRLPPADVPPRAAPRGDPLLPPPDLPADTTPRFRR